jgi:hypothetical protein
MGRKRSLRTAHIAWQLLRSPGDLAATTLSNCLMLRYKNAFEAVLPRGDYLFFQEI